MFFFLVLISILTHTGASIGLTLLVPRRGKKAGVVETTYVITPKEDDFKLFYIQFQKGSSLMDGIDARLSVQTR